MSGQSLRRLATIAILTATAGCDNVEWRGVEVRLVPPPPARFGAPADSAAGGAEGATYAVPTDAPVLYMGRRDSTGMRLVPVGAIRGDSLEPFPADAVAPGYRGDFARQLMAPGTRFTLFSAGSRIGTFTARDVGTDESFCTARPFATGVAELVPGADAATTFLALPEAYTRDIAFGSFQPAEHTLQQRSAGIDLAAALIPQLGATWPTSMVQARGDIMALELADGRPAVSTTFVFRDQVEIQPAEPTSYSLYLLAAPEDGDRYQPALVWYRVAGSDGKGAPRYFQHLDWDADGETEVLLEVLGERSRWSAVVEPRGGEWARTFEDPCGAAAPPVQERQDG